MDITLQDENDDIHQPTPAHGNANKLPKGWSSSHTHTNTSPPNNAADRLNQELKQQPLVSIVLPVYNGEEFLSECLHSIAMQTHRPLELAVCDNGSTDSTPQILAAGRVKLEVAGVQYVCVTTGDADPRGCGYGRNRALEVATGAWSHCCICTVLNMHGCRMSFSDSVPAVLVQNLLGAFCMTHLYDCRMVILCVAYRSNKNTHACFCVFNS